MTLMVVGIAMFAAGCGGSTAGSDVTSAPSTERTGDDPTTSLTAGTMPVGDGGLVNPEDLPDLLAVDDGSGNIAGYHRREDLYPTDPGALPLEVVPVYDETGQTLLGHFFMRGVGFLTLDEQEEQGVSPDDPPPGTPPSTSGE